MKHLFMQFVFISFYFELKDCAPHPQPSFGASDPYFSEQSNSQQMIAQRMPVYVYGVPIFPTRDQSEDVAVLVKARPGFPLDNNGSPIQLIPPNPIQIPMDSSGVNGTTTAAIENYGNKDVATTVAGETAAPTAAADTPAPAAPAADATTAAPAETPAAETTAAAAADSPPAA